MNILKINKLTKNFFLHNANREIHSCRNISFTLDEGKFLGMEEVDGSNPLNSSSINHIATPFARNCERRLFSFFCRLGHYEGTNSIKK